MIDVPDMTIAVGDTDAAQATVPVSELFGPTLQGEGPFAGRPVQFLRLGGCNLSCSWCDTAYTWDGSRFDLRAEITPMTGQEIADGLTPGLDLVLSGGEPLLHQHNPGLLYALDMAKVKGCRVHVETNGTLVPSTDFLPRCSVYVVSPKLAHAGSHRGNQNPAIHPSWSAIAGWNWHAFLKVVVQEVSDVAAVLALATRLRWPRERVWVMPEGTTAEALLRNWPYIATAAAQAGINATQRLHVLAWGDCKGT